MSFVLDYRGEIIAQVINYSGSLYVVNPSNHSAIYDITNVDPSSGSASYSQIVLERNAQADNETFLKNVKIADVYALPAAPWVRGTGGDIILKSPLSVQQLLDGALQLNLKENGEAAPSVRFYQNPSDPTVITVMSGGNTVFGVGLSPSADAATRIVLNYIYEQTTFNLESAQLN